MASIYLVNALYNKPSARATPAMQGMTEVKQEVVASDDQSAVAVKEPATTTVTTDSAAAAAAATGTGGQTIGAGQAEVKSEQREQQKGAGDAMHPARQLMVEFLGPLDEEPEPVPYRVTGANMAPLGQTPQHGPKKRGKGAMNKHKLVAPKPPASGNIQGARERASKAVAPSPIAAVRFGQRVLAFSGNQVNAERDPRRRVQAGEGYEAPSSPAPASGVLFGHALVKQEEAAQDTFVHPRPNPFALAAATVLSSPQQAGPVPFHPMVGPDQLHRPVSSVGAPPNTLAVRPKQLESDPASDPEIRIRELEDENLGLRQAGFFKDREIRKLKAELLELGIRPSAAQDAAIEASMKGVEAGIKRPRYDENVGGSVMEP